MRKLKHLLRPKDPFRVIWAFELDFVYYITHVFVADLVCGNLLEHTPARSQYTNSYLSYSVA